MLRDESEERMTMRKMRRDTKDQVVVAKSVGIIGHSIARNLLSFIDQRQDYTRNFGLETARVRWLTVGGLKLKDMNGCGWDFIRNQTPDVIVLQIMDNDVDSHKGLQEVVDGHVFFAEEVVAEFGSAIKVVICAPLHRSTPKYMSRELYNSRVEECIKGMRHRLGKVVSTGTEGKKRPVNNNVFFWEHKKLRGLTQLRSDGVHLTDVGSKRLYFSLKTAIRELVRY